MNQSDNTDKLEKRRTKRRHGKKKFNNFSIKKRNFFNLK